MNIDAHQHFWKYRSARDAWITDNMKVLQRDFMADELAHILSQHDISGCVAVQADQSEEETTFLIQQARENTFIKGVIGWVDLKAKDIEERLLQFSKIKIVKGFRHIVQAEAESDFLLRPDFNSGIALLSKFNFTYDILIRAKHLPHANQFVEQYPSQKFVIDHIAKPAIKDGLIDHWKKYIKKIAAHKNVYCKVSGLVTEADWENWKSEDFVPYLDVVFDAFGADRTMYGSDWPVCLVAATYEMQLNILKNYLSSFSETERQNVMGTNAINFYNL